MVFELKVPLHFVAGFCKRYITGPVGVADVPDGILRQAGKDVGVCLGCSKLVPVCGCWASGQHLAASQLRWGHRTARPGLACPLPDRRTQPQGTTGEPSRRAAKKPQPALGKPVQGPVALVQAALHSRCWPWLLGVIYAVQLDRAGLYLALAQWQLPGREPVALTTLFVSGLQVCMTSGKHKSC